MVKIDTTNAIHRIRIKMNMLMDCVLVDSGCQFSIHS